MKSVAAPPMKREPGPAGFSIFAGYLPSVDRWLARRAAIKGLAAEADRLEGIAKAWEQRGHYEMAGKLKERGAKMAQRSLDMTFTRETLKRRDGLLRGAIVDYALEMG